jgi:hypothetical protein
VVASLRQGALAVEKLPDGWFSELAVFAGFDGPDGRARYRAVAEEELVARVIDPLAERAIAIA